MSSYDCDEDEGAAEDAMSYADDIEDEEYEYVDEGDDDSNEFNLDPNTTPRKLRK